MGDMENVNNLELTSEEFEALDTLINLGINCPEVDEDVDHRDDLMYWGGIGYTKLCEYYEASQKQQEKK